MRFATPALAVTPESWNVTDLLLNRIAEDPDRTILEVRRGKKLQEVSGAEFLTEITAVAKGLVAHGVEPGDRIALMSRTRYEWTLFDFAIWAAGAVSVPIYETSSVSQVAWICADAGVKAAVVEADRHAEVMAEARAEVPDLREVWRIDGDLEALKRAGRDVPTEEIERRREAARGEDLATIIYTSGTTGRPKGVELTHANFVWLVVNVREYLTEVCMPTDARYLAFMPLAHIFARAVQMIVFGSNAVTGFAPDTRNLVQDMGIFRPTFILAVPRVFEKVYNAAEQKAGSGLRLRMFRWAAKVAIVHSRRTASASGPSLPLRAQHLVSDVLVYRRLHQALGGNLRWAISGGAPLGDRLGHYFRGIGLNVLEGYGLTETTAPVSVNPVGKVKIGTVGPPLPGTEIRIAESGEIQVRGGGVFRGYHRNPEATAQALHEGWFGTGDLGTMDEDGYLSITGRMKEIIVTAGGKNVSPAVLEDRLRGHPLVSQCVVVGDARPYVGVLICLDAEMLPGWLVNHGRPVMSPAQAAADPVVLDSLQKAVDRANRAVSRAESIRKFAILDTDFTEANGYLTPSLKVKRERVLRDYASAVDDLYGGPLSGPADAGTPAG